MKQESLRKKKRWVKKEQGKEIPVKTKRQAQEETDQGQERELTYPFDYSFDHLIMVVLRRMLQDIPYRIDLNRKQITGSSQDVGKFIRKVDKFMKSTTSVTLMLYEGTQPDQIHEVLKQCHQGQAENSFKMYNRKLITKIVKKFFYSTAYEEQYEQFLFQLEGNTEDQIIYVTLKRNYYQEFIRQIEENGMAEIMGPKKNRGRRRNRKKQIASLTIPKEDLEPGEVTTFYRRNKSVHIRDISICQNRPYGKLQSYTVSLSCDYNELQVQDKLEAFNYYFEHHDIVELPLTQSKHKDELIEQFGSIKKASLSIRLLKGYKSSKWETKTLLHKIRTQERLNKKTNYLNTNFQCFHLKGLLPLVKQHVNQLTRAVNETAPDQAHEQVFITFSKSVERCLKASDEAQKFVTNFIEEYVRQFKDVCHVEEMYFINQVFKLEMTVLSGQQEEYREVKMDLEHIMPKQLSIQSRQLDFAVDQQFRAKLQQEGFVVVDTNDRGFSFLEVNSRIVKAEEKLQNIIKIFEVFSEETIEAKGPAKLKNYQQIMSDIVKSKEFTGIFLAQPISEDNINFKVSSYGPRKKNEVFSREVREKIQETERKMGQYYQSVDKDLSQVVVQDQAFQHQIQSDFKVSLIVDDSVQVQARLEFDNGILSILRSKSLQRVPVGSRVVFGSKKQIMDRKEQFMNLFRVKAKATSDHYSNNLLENQPTRNLELVLSQSPNGEEMLQLALDTALENKVVVLPQKARMNFTDTIIRALEKKKVYQPFNIFLIDLSSDTSIQKMVGIPEYTGLKVSQEQEVTEWYCQNFPFSKSGNNKINTALACGQQQVLLVKEDMSQVGSKSTHVCDLARKVIISRRNQQQIPITVSPNSIQFTVLGRTVAFPHSEFNIAQYYQRLGVGRQFNVTLLFYLVDLINKRQINIFTNYQRSITCKKSTVKVQKGENRQIKAFYNVPQTHFIYSFEQTNAKNLIPCIEMIQQYSESKLIRQGVIIKGLQDKTNLRDNIENRAKQSGLKYELDPHLKHITIQSYKRQQIEKLRKLIELQVSYLETLEQMSKQSKSSSVVIQYPLVWQKQQSDVNTFELSQQSAQFLRVRQTFGYEVKKILRVQNKILFQKYQKELNHLTAMNGTKPKEMQLFHGTGGVPAETIYGDKEQGFNINYSRDTNLLGRGIYFAEQSQYSHTYASHEHGGRGMLLCSVIVGESQNMAMTHGNGNVTDTKQKVNGLHYQSMKGKHSICDIYVVYRKNRAYPTHLIVF